jgi:hypothetical protein
MVYFIIILFIIGVFITALGFVIRLENYGEEGGIPFIVIGALILIGTLIWVLYNDPKWEADKEKYKETEVLVTKSAKVTKMDMVKTRNNNTFGKIELLIILEGGIIAEINSQLFSTLDEGMDLYWDECIKNCKYYEYNSSNRNFYIK